MSTTEAYALPLTLGQQIRAARNRTGLDQDELGVRLSVNRTTISRWERDLAVPPFTAVVTLSGLSGWPLDLFARAITPSDNGPDMPPGLEVSPRACYADVIDFGARRTRAPSVADISHPIAS